MSVQNEIDRINNNIANTYATLNEAGATMPETRNSNNLSATAASISAVLFSKAQNLTAAQQQQARDNIGVEAVEGPQGPRGTGVLKVTTAPSSYTTATGGFTPTYRISLSTVKTQSKVSNVIAGDIIQYSYYLYPVGYVDSNYVYTGARTSLRGATGAAGADGNGILSVVQTTTSNADGGSNILTITEDDGTTSTFTVRNGSKGSTPMKGTDYYTPADQESIVQQVIAALGTPVFGRVDSDNNIILTGELADGTYTVKYEDARGNLTDIGTLNQTHGPDYTNQIPISTDTDGSVYNGVGYKTESRGNSSGEIVDLTGGSNPPFCTGFIPCKKGDIIRLKNCYIHATTQDTDAFKALYGNTGPWGIRFGLYNSSKAKIAVESWGNLSQANNATDILSDYTRVPEGTGLTQGMIYQFKIAYANTAYIRLCLAADVANGCTPADAIVTVNEEIE